MKKSQAITNKTNAVEYIKGNGIPKVGSFEDKKALQKFYKQLPTETLEEWAKQENVTFNPCTDNEAIHRMRVAMAILYLHFPKETKEKKESPYKKYTTEQLVEMALEHDVAIEETDDMRILRMRLIMGLRANKVIS